MEDVPPPHVSPGTHHPPPQANLLTHELTRKLADLTAKVAQLDVKTTKNLHQIDSKSSEDMSDLRASLLTLRKEHESLGTNHTKLREEHTRLQYDHVRLETDLKHLQTHCRRVEQTLAELKMYLHAFQADHKQVLEHQSLFKEERTKLMTKMTNIRPDLPTPPSSAGKLGEQQSDADDEFLSTNMAEMTSGSHDLASVEDRHVHQVSADLSRLRSDVTRLDNDNWELRSEVVKLRTGQDELVRDRNSMGRLNCPETNQGELLGDIADQRMVRLQKDHIDTVLADQRCLQQRQVDGLRTYVDQRVAPLEESQRNFTELEMRLRKTVSFFVKGVDTDKTKQYRPIVFKKLWVNHGGGYDVTTGKFTAAVPGTYTFSATVGSCEEKTDVRGYLCVNNTEYGLLSGSSTATGCASVSVQLKTGDMVWVKARSSPGDYFPIDTTFTGALVQPEM